MKIMIAQQRFMISFSQTAQAPKRFKIFIGSRMIGRVVFRNRLDARMCCNMQRILQQESTSLTKQANLSKRRRRSQTNVPVLGSSNVNNKVPATSVTRWPVFISRLPYYEKSRFGVLRKVQLAQFRQPSWRMRSVASTISIRSL